MRKIYLFFLVPLLLAALAIFARQSLLPKLLCAYFGRQLKSEVSMERISWGIIDGIKAKGISVKNRRGLSCNIESADIEIALIDGVAGFLKRRGLGIDLRLREVKFSYPHSAVINSISQSLSLDQPELINFDNATGRLYKKGRELILKELTASGRHIRLFADGTITDDSGIECKLKLFLSRELVSGIPEATRKVFFKPDGPWSEIEIYLSGDFQRPSINLSTDLFKLIVR